MAYQKINVNQYITQRVETSPAHSGGRVSFYKIHPADHNGAEGTHRYRLRAEGNFIDAAGNLVKAGTWGGIIDHVLDSINFSEYIWIGVEGAIINSSISFLGKVLINGWVKESSVRFFNSSPSIPIVVPEGCEIKDADISFCFHHCDSQPDGKERVITLNKDVIYRHGEFNDPDFLLSKAGEIFASTGKLPDPDGYYTFYKNVWKEDRGKGKRPRYHSDFDYNFTYTPGRMKVCKKVAPRERGQCQSGIHVATETYSFSSNCKLQLRVHIDDIVWWGDEKMRCSKVYVVGEVKEWGYK